MCKTALRYRGRRIQYSLNYAKYERTKDGIAAARAKGKLPGRRLLDPEKASAALKLVVAGTSPTEAARQLVLGPASVYREMAIAG